MQSYGLDAMYSEWIIETKSASRTGSNEESLAMSLFDKIIARERDHPYRFGYPLLMGAGYWWFFLTSSKGVEKGRAACAYLSRCPHFLPFYFIVLSDFGYKSSCMRL